MTTREPRFTEQDVAELLALATTREGVCPACGGPIDECTSHEATGPKFVARYTLCRRREQLAIAQKTKSDAEHPEAWVWWMDTIRR